MSLFSSIATRSDFMPSDSTRAASVGTGASNVRSSPLIWSFMPDANVSRPECSGEGSRCFAPWAGNCVRAAPLHELLGFAENEFPGSGAAFKVCLHQQGRVRKSGFFDFDSDF